MGKIVSGIDTFFNKVLPKKFIVFMVACYLIFEGKLSGDMWAYIAMIYIGLNVVQKFNPKPFHKEEENRSHHEEH